MVKTYIFIFIFTFTAFGFEGPQYTSEDLVQNGDIIGAFYTYMYENQEKPNLEQRWSGPPPKPDAAEQMRIVSNFLTTYNSQIVNSGMSKEVILEQYLGGTYSSTEKGMFNYNQDGTLKVEAEKYDFYNEVKDQVLATYPQMQSTADQIDTIKNNFSQYKKDPEKLYSIYMADDGSMNDLALDIMFFKADNSFYGQAPLELTADQKLSLLGKMNTDKPDEMVAMNALNRVLSNTPSYFNNKLLDQEHIKYIKGVLEGIDQNYSYPIYGENGKHEPIACFQIYQKEKFYHMNKEFSQGNANYDPEQSKMFDMIEVVDSYTYFNAVGIDTSQTCSDGQTYIDKVNKFLKDELQINEEDVCKMVLPKPQGEQGMIYKYQGKSDSAILDHELSMLEGMYSLLGQVDIDSEHKCNNGKSINENLSDMAAKIEQKFELLNEGVPLRDQLYFPLINGDDEIQNLPSCETTLEDLIEGNLPCDVSHIISSLQVSLKKMEKEGKGKSKKSEDFDLKLSPIGGISPDMKDGDCYLTMLATYVDGKAKYKLTARIVGINYHVKVQEQEFSSMKKYFEELKRIAAVKTRAQNQ